MGTLMAALICHFLQQLNLVLVEMVLVEMENVERQETVVEVLEQHIPLQFQFA